jgi:hypothetical protein
MDTGSLMHFPCHVRGVPTGDSFGGGSNGGWLEQDFLFYREVFWRVQVSERPIMSQQKDTKISLDKVTFWSRLQGFYDSWKKGGKIWGGDDTDAIILMYGEEDEDVLYSRSIAVELALIGYGSLSRKQHLS